MASSDATFHLNATTVTSRSAENTSADWADGCNRGGSCAPGIGIGTAAGAVGTNDWTLLDQDGDARNPQNSQHIGGDGLGPSTPDGTSGGVSGKGTDPINVADYVASDFNDTVDLTDLNTGWVRTTV